jgi:AcrR family transcriptional regulator
MINNRQAQSERSKATINALQTAAIEAFGNYGYDAASLDKICAAADVTKGALYHHFPGGKVALFEAVVILEQERMRSAMMAASLGAQTEELALRQSLAAYFDIALEPHMYRITLLDAPAVLGLEKWREIEYRYSLAVIRKGIDKAMGSSTSDRYRAMLASGLFGSACELTLAIAASHDVEQARAHAIDIMVMLFSDAVRQR